MDFWKIPSPMYREWKRMVYHRACGMILKQHLNSKYAL
jgi:hypothetical protein